jgi:hypothetical protein
MRAAICILAVTVAARTAAADAPKLAPVDEKALPADVRPGAPTLEKAYTFTDKNGTNYLLFSNKRTCDTGWLFVDHYAVAAGAKKARLVREVKELVESCSSGMSLGLHADALGVTDLDGDGYAEITFGYERGCRTDATPDDYKLLVLENGDKYILRGHSVIDTKDASDPTDGGDFTPDPAKGKWPAAFYKHATEVWAKTDADWLIPPGSRASGEDPAVYIQMNQCAD